MNYNGARILEKQPMAEVWDCKSMKVVKCQPWRIWSEFSCWPQDLWNIRRASWSSCNPSCSTSPYKSYLLQGAFLTVPTNFQYQNEKWWAANQRFCSMKFSMYKWSSLVEQRFFWHWNLGGTVKKAPCRNLISQRNTYCIWIRKWKVRNNPTLPVCSTFPDKYRNLVSQKSSPGAPSNPSLCQLYCLRVCL